MLAAHGTYGPGSGAPVRRAADWLLAMQLPDGGWGDGQAGSPPLNTRRLSLFSHPLAPSHGFRQHQLMNRR
jgi:hypothetical protein